MVCSNLESQKASKQALSNRRRNSPIFSSLQAPQPLLKLEQGLLEVLKIANIVTKKSCLVNSKTAFPRDRKNKCCLKYSKYNYWPEYMMPPTREHGRRRAHLCAHGEKAEQIQHAIDRETRRKNSMPVCTRGEG